MRAGPKHHALEDAARLRAEEGPENRARAGEDFGVLVAE